MNFHLIGRPVDAFIVPIAPHAAVILGKFYHSGKSPLSVVPAASLHPTLSIL